MINVANVSLHLRIEQRFGCDAQPQPHHLGMDVEHLAVVPAIKHLTGERHHGTPMRSKLPARENRRDQMALALPRLALIGEQSFSEHRCDIAPEEPVLDLRQESFRSRVDR